MDGASADVSLPKGRRRLPLSAVAAGMVIGFAIAVAAILIVLFVFFRDSTPVLTETMFEEAVGRWQRRGPASYNLDISVTGRQPGKIHVEVRDGAATSMTRDGVTPRQRRTWEYWTIPGQFETIQQDWESAHDPEGGFGLPPGTKVSIRAAFDDELGFPAVYRRRVLGTPLIVEWEIDRFEIVP